MAQAAVVVGNSNVEGNISTCQILNQNVKTDRKYWYSFTEDQHYQSFNTCTGQAIHEWTVTDISVLWAIPVLIFIIGIPIVLLLKWLFRD